MKYVFKILLYASLLLSGAAALTGCTDNTDDVNSVQRSKLVSDLIVPSKTFYTSNVSELTIQGKGFETGDSFVLLSTDGQEKILTIIAIDHKYVTFAVPEDIDSGEFVLILKRGGQSQELGVIRLRVSIDLNVPDKAGATVKGAVFCGKEPVAGAVVSDGKIVTKTDEYGYYWLESTRSRGYVFVSTPNGYEPLRDGSIPQMWGMTTDAEVDQINFELLEVDNDNHVMIVMSDAHLANLAASQDLAQYNNRFVNDLKSFIASEYAGRSVYAIHTGDLTSDWLWYTNPVYTIENYAASLNGYKLPFMMYHCPGNHDNDPKIAGDMPSEATYIKALGPTYYSFNIGGIHYVMLDNVIFLNPNGSSSTVGDRTYREGFTDMQIEWLKADLAEVAAETPVYVGLHCPVYYYDPASGTPSGGMPSTEKAKLLDCLDKFHNVHFMSGHTHNNVNMKIKSGMTEHNLVAASTDWWWSGYYTGRINGAFNVNDAIAVSMDGTPQGYAVYEVSEGRVSNSYLKATGKPRAKQFLAYDMNKVKDFYITSPNNSVLKLYNYTNKDGLNFADRKFDYADVDENVVFINVWNWNPDWQISVKEGQQELAVTKVSKPDPMHTLCLEVATMTANGQISSLHVSKNSRHMFSAKAGSSNSTVFITVKDQYGNEFTETMVRPKEFSRTMP